MKFDRFSPNWPISNSLSLSREKLRFHFPRRDSVSFEIGFRNLKEKLFLIPSSRSIIIGWRILVLRRLLRAGPLLHENKESGSDSNYSSVRVNPRMLLLLVEAGSGETHGGKNLFVTGRVEFVNGNRGGQQRGCLRG